MTNFYKVVLVIASVVSINVGSVAASEPQSTEFEDCLAKLVVTASPETQVADLHSQCNRSLHPSADQIDTAVEQRVMSEKAIATNPFSLVQHRDNYVLPVAYNFKSEAIAASSIPGDVGELDPTEFKFQLSFKSLLWDSPLGSRARLYAAYTNTSWWQAYNREESSPFRETNHQPEMFLDLPSDYQIGAWELTQSRLGLSHISNGRTGEFSRTWNRVYAEFTLGNDANEIVFKPWISVSDMDGNDDIEDFAGRFELLGNHLIGDHSIGWRLRHTLDSNANGSISLDWAFPILGRDDMRFFAQYFEGYGESLIDYNIKSRRLGFGFKLGI